MIHVVTVVHDRREITEKFIELLLKQDICGIHLILVDDGCTDGTPEMAREIMPDCTVIHGNGDLWWGGGLHQAYRWLRDNQVDSGDAVLISNDDTEFDSEYISRGIRHLEEQPHTMAVGTGYGLQSGKRLDGLYTHSYRDGTGHLVEEGQSGNCASTRSLFLTVGDWMTVGGFHPILLPHYASDFEFTLRASRKGIGLYSYPDLTYKFNEGTTGENDYEELTLRSLFSKRSNSNPFYKLSFVILSTPVRYLPEHLAHQLGRFISKAGTFAHIVKRRD